MRHIWIFSQWDEVKQKSVPIQWSVRGDEGLVGISEDLFNQSDPEYMYIECGYFRIGPYKLKAVERSNLYGVVYCDLIIGPKWFKSVETVYQW